MYMAPGSETQERVTNKEGTDSPWKKPGPPVEEGRGTLRARGQIWGLSSTLSRKWTFGLGGLVCEMGLRPPFHP